MKLRNLLAVGVVGALVSSSFASYTARLYFEDITKGTSNAGQVSANVGDLIGIHFVFHGTGSTPNKFGTIQITLCDTEDAGGILMNSADVGNWVANVTTAIAPTGGFALKDIYGPNTLYDNSLDASDNSSALVCKKGVYFYGGIKGSDARAKDWDVTLFQFHAAGAVGNTLDWSRDANPTGTGLSTRIIDGSNKTVDITDNFVKIVPEPGSVAAIFGGLTGLLAIRRRK